MAYSLPYNVFLACLARCVTSPRWFWRLPVALGASSPTTFYPCELQRPSPDSVCVLRRQSEAQRRRPHLNDGLLRRPGIFTGRLHQCYGHNPNPSQTLATATKACTKPDTEGAVRLKAEPTPR